MIVSTDSGFRVRRATDADSAAVRSLVREVAAEFGLVADALADEDDLVAVASHYERDGGWFEVLFDSDGLAGTIGMLPVEPGVIELRKMYFHPRLRGHGLGKALLARNLRHARERGFDTVVLETATVLETARALYARFGFEREAGGARSCGSGCDQSWRLSLHGYRVPAMDLVALREVSDAESPR